MMRSSLSDRSRSDPKTCPNLCIEEKIVSHTPVTEPVDFIERMFVKDFKAAIEEFGSALDSPEANKRFIALAVKWEALISLDRFNELMERHFPTRGAQS